MPQGSHCSWAAFEEKNVKSKEKKGVGREENIFKEVFQNKKTDFRAWKHTKILVQEVSHAGFI